MRKRTHSDNQPLDARLADFVDQLLASGKAPEADAPAMDSEMEGLRKTVMQIHEIKPGEPPPAFVERLRSRLAQEYDAAVKTPGKKRSGENAWRSSAGRQQTYMLRLAVGIVIGLVILLPFIYQGGDGLPGAAVGLGQWGPLIILLAGALAVGVWLSLRRK